MSVCLCLNSGLKIHQQQWGFSVLAMEPCCCQDWLGVCSLGLVDKRSSGFTGLGIEAVVGQYVVCELKKNHIKFNASQTH